MARAKAAVAPSPIGWTPPPPQIGPIRNPRTAPDFVVPDFVPNGINENDQYEGSDPGLLRQNRRASGNLADDPTESGAPVINSNPIAGRR